MAQSWNDPNLPWNNPNLPWRSRNMKHNAENLPWKNDSAAGGDVTAPTVSSSSPADNATDVAIDTDIVFTFDEPIVLGASGTITLKATSDNSTVDSWDVSADEGSGAGQCEVLNSDELHLHLTTDLANSTEVYVVWDAGVVTDVAENNVAAQASTTAYSFTTVAAAGYTANAVTFDGSNDYFSSQTISGLSNSKSGTLSCWLNFAAGGDGVEQVILATANSHFKFYRRDDNLLLIDATNAAGSQILGMYLSSIESSDGWVHALASWDQASGGARQFYKNDVSGVNVYSNSDDTIDYTDGSSGYNGFSVNGSGAQKFNGDIADFWFMPGVHIDLSVEANRRKFIDANGKPVNLGSDGSTPTGSAPPIFLSGATGSWHTNKGSGGGFTLNGTLATASTSPSD